jgi:type II secretory ATPase GspE/PulE/Tfp pilus assembly ATPase PilB-like protein
MGDDTSALVIVEKLVRQAEQAGASDVHLHMTHTGAQVAFRLDGVLTTISTIDGETAERVFGRIKYLARLKTYQDSLPQDGRINKADTGTRHDIRVATYPTVTGEKIVLRLFNESSTRNLDALGLPSSVCDQLQSFLSRPSGLLLLTGPAGSGKTTTIYACLRHLAAQGGRHIITVEDPVEQVIPGIMQTEINEARGLTFSKAARHLLRQDPQVLVIGEIRDDETANIAVRAALTGHMVISTIHAGSCRGVWERLLVMCDDQYAVVSVTDLVLNQRLIRRVCPDCGGIRCESCLQTGYKGSVPLVEWVRMTDALRHQVRDRGIEAINPPVTLTDAARELVARGVTTDSEAKRVTA